MGHPTPRLDRCYARLCDSVALNIVLDECIIASLSETVAVLREAGDTDLSKFEHVIRSYRIGIMKQRSILGAVGRDL